MLAIRSSLIEEIGGFGDPWTFVSRGVMRRIARLEHGRKWLVQRASNSPFFGRDIVREMLKEVLKEAENTSCEDWLNEALRLSG